MVWRYPVPRDLAAEYLRSASRRMTVLMTMEQCQEAKQTVITVIKRIASELSRVCIVNPRLPSTRPQDRYRIFSICSNPIE